MGNNIVTSLKATGIQSLAQTLNLPNGLKSQNYMTPGTKGPIKATQITSNKLVGASKINHVSSPFEKKVSDIVKDVPQASKTATKDGFFTGLRNKSNSTTKEKESNEGQIELKSKYLKKPDEGIIKKLVEEETDERYRYLLKNGIVHAVEPATKRIYVELPQIQGILIVYRKPSERQSSPEMIDLSDRDMAHIPLLEGEEKLRVMNLQDNKITKVENLVSLPSLQSLNLKGNKLTELSSFAI